MPGYLFRVAKAGMRVLPARRALATPKVASVAAPEPVSTGLPPAPVRGLETEPAPPLRPAVGPATEERPDPAAPVESAPRPGAIADIPPAWPGSPPAPIVPEAASATGPDRASSAPATPTPSRRAPEPEPTAPVTAERSAAVPEAEPETPDEPEAIRPPGISRTPRLSTSVVPVAQPELSRLTVGIAAGGHWPRVPRVQTEREGEVGNVRDDVRADPDPPVARDPTRLAPGRPDAVTAPRAEPHPAPEPDPPPTPQVRPPARPDDLPAVPPAAQPARPAGGLTIQKLEVQIVERRRAEPSVPPAAPEPPVASVTWDWPDRRYQIRIG